VRSRSTPHGSQLDLLRQTASDAEASNQQTLEMTDKLAAQLRAFNCPCQNRSTCRQAGLWRGHSDSLVMVTMARTLINFRRSVATSPPCERNRNLRINTKVIVPAWWGRE
jgi:hypothetical protein